MFTLTVSFYRNNPMIYSYEISFFMIMEYCITKTYFLNSYFNDTALRVSTLMWDLGNKMQLCIQGYNKRPYGVGLLVAGYDDLGPHIYQVRYFHLFCMYWNERSIQPSKI